MFRKERIRLKRQKLALSSMKGLRKGAHEFRNKMNSDSFYRIKNL